MKICGIICEFNPFHNGHEYFLGQVRALSGCDAVVCIMSGSFTQRGDICIADKFQRAKHAVYGGADCVLELPAAFTVAPAEIFASGAVKILSSVPDFDTLAFGCESGTAEDFFAAAELLLEESENFKAALRRGLDAGESYIKSYASAFVSAGGQDGLLSTPNNILGVEYAKAVLRFKPNIKLLPIKRVGAGYADGHLKENYSSASAIRRNLSSPLVKDNVPEYVFKDLNGFAVNDDFYGKYLRLILSRTSPEILQKIYGCCDGLENLLKSLQSLELDEIIENATSKRYSSSRIMRILCANFLELYQSDCEKFLNGSLYFYPLAVKAENAPAVLSALSKSAYPVLTCGSDEKKLSKTAALCKQKDDFSYLQWQQITGQKPIKKFLLIK